MEMRKKLLLAMILAMCQTTPTHAREDDHHLLIHGGRSTAPADSLGFDAYAELSDDEQLERRQRAKRWMKRGIESEEQPAVDFFATAVGFCPTLPEAWLRYALALNAIGRYDSASNCLIYAERTLKDERSGRTRERVRKDVGRLRATVAFNQGELDRALQLAAETLEQFEDDSDVRILQARILIEMGRLEAAETILKAFPSDDRLYAKALASQAQLHQRNDNLEAAAVFYASAYAQGQRDAHLQNDWGRLLLDQQQPAAAVAHFRQALEQAPDFLQARSNLAVAYRRSGERDAALATLQECLDASGDYAPAHFNLAEIYRDIVHESQGKARTEAGRLALRHYDLALEFGYAPDAIVERRGGLAIHLGDLAGAESDLSQVVTDTEATGRALYMLGRVKKERRDYDGALELFKQAVARGYDAYDVYSDLGYVYLRMGDLEAACEQLRSAIQRNPELVVTRVNLSVALSQLGKLKEADEVLREAEARDPQSALVKTQRAALRHMGVRR